jgi:hypothetical protein
MSDAAPDSLWTPRSYAGPIKSANDRPQKCDGAVENADLKTDDGVSSSSSKDDTHNVH